MTDDIAGYIRRMQGSVEWRADKNGKIGSAVAKVRDLNMRVSCRQTHPC